jgi:hypothetical protein
MFLSVDLGIGVPFALYFTDTSFKEPDELSDAYGIPVNGIPYLAEIKGEKARVMRSAIGFTCVAGLVVGAVWIYAKLLY